MSFDNGFINFDTDEDGIIISSQLAYVYGIKTVDTIPIKINNKIENLKVSGVSQLNISNTMYISHSKLNIFFDNLDEKSYNVIYSTDFANLDDTHNIYLKKYMLAVCSENNKDIKYEWIHKLYIISLPELNDGKTSKYFNNNILKL